MLTNAAYTVFILQIMLTWRNNFERTRRKTYPIFVGQAVSDHYKQSASKEGAFKIKIRPVMVKDQLCFQETTWKGNQVFHENYEKEEALTEILLQMENKFKQLEAESMDGRLIVLVSKKGKITIKHQENKGETRQRNLICPITGQKIFVEGRDSRSVSG